MRMRLWFVTGTMLTLGFVWMQMHAGAQDTDIAPSAGNTVVPDAAPVDVAPLSTPPTPPASTGAATLPMLPLATPPSGATPPVLPAPTAPVPAPSSDLTPAPGAPTPALTIPADGEMLPPPETLRGAAPTIPAPPTVVTSAGPGFGGVQLNSRDMRLQEVRLAHEAEQLAREQSPNDEKKREQVRAVIKEKLNQVFDMQQARRAEEIAAIEARLTKLKETLEKRKQAKETIVDRRLAQLVGDDELGWEDSAPSITTYSSGTVPYGGGQMLTPALPSNQYPALYNNGPYKSIPARQPQRN